MVHLEIKPPVSMMLSGTRLSKATLCLLMFKLLNFVLCCIGTFFNYLYDDPHNPKLLGFYTDGSTQT